MINKIINFRARAFSAHPGKDLSEEHRRSAAISIYLSLMSTDIIHGWLGAKKTDFETISHNIINEYANPWTRDKGETIQRVWQFVSVGDCD